MNENGDLNEGEDPTERSIAAYLLYLELGGEKPDLSHLDPVSRRTVEEVIGMLELTDGVPIGMGREEGKTDSGGPPQPRVSQEAVPTEAADAGAQAFAELRSSLPPEVRLVPDADVEDFSSPDLPILSGWKVGTFGGRVRVWLVDEADASRLDSEVSPLAHLNRAFQALPNTAAIALVCRDLSCLVLEPSDCAPTIEVPTGAISPKRLRRPIQEVGEAVSSFLVELIPSWEPIPGLEGGDLLSVDVEELAADSASNAIRTQQSAGARARFPRKDVLSALGQTEVESLAEMILEVYGGRGRSEQIPARLTELAGRR